MDEQNTTPESDSPAPDAPAANATTADESTGSIDGSASTEGQPRRNFISSVLAGAISAVVGLVPLVTGLLFFLGPLFKKKDAGAAVEGGVEKDSEGRIKVASLGSLPTDGSPRKFTIYDDRQDAWNMFLKQQVGAVYLRKGEGDTVDCLNVICPHLGCSVDYRSDENDYYCPCHLSAFALDGAKQNDIPPRDLDKLDTKVDENGDVWVKFQDYKAGESQQIPVG